MTQASESTEHRVYRENLELSRLEYQAGRIHLWSRPRSLGIVLGNACNLNCLHCYQAKNGDHLLRPPRIGRELRREFVGLYPYLATLRIMGGEVLALAGFEDLVEDLRTTVTRPILSISTNGTLVDDAWAERIVRTPMLSLTVSIDGATPGTMARLRGGADLGRVLAGVRRVMEWKRRLASELPAVNAFFVVMRSNFREIPAFLKLMRENGVTEAALQTLEINRANLRRVPTLERDESIRAPREVRELEGILRRALAAERPRFRMIRVSGLTGLLAAHGLETGFLCEREQGLYPDSDDLAGPHGFECCPNPWTTLFIDEGGGAYLCFLSEPVGNLYETPLAALWNSQGAMAKRSQVLAGRYTGSGCSEQWCGWRAGHAAGPAEAFLSARTRWRELTRQVLESPAATGMEDHQAVAAVRRALGENNRRLAELEARFSELCRTNAVIHETGQRHIDSLEARLAHPLVRAAEKAARALRRARDRARDTVFRESHAASEPDVRP